MTGILPAKVNSRWHSSHLGSSNAMWQLSETTASIFKLIGSSNCHWEEEISVLYMEKQLLFFPNGFSGMKAVQVIWIVTAIILRECISSYSETSPPQLLFFFFPSFLKMSVTVCASLAEPDLSLSESVSRHFSKASFFFLRMWPLTQAPH